MKDTIIKMIFFDWGGTLAHSGTRQHFIDRHSSLDEKRSVLFPGVLETLKRLKKKGFKLGIISNTSVSRHQMINALHSSRIAHLFDYHLYSSEPGVCPKPNPDIFLQALIQNGLRPQEAIYVGNRYYKDVLGAHNVGMHPIYVGNEQIPSAHRKPHWKITHLPQMLRILR